MAAQISPGGGPPVAENVRYLVFLAFGFQPIALLDRRYEMFIIILEHFN